MQKNDFPFLTVAGVLLCLALASPANADINWLPDESSHDGSGGGSNPGDGFMEVDPGVGMTTDPAPSAPVAHGNGTNLDGIYTFGFTNGPNANPVFADTELSAGPLVAGTTLTLVFSKELEDRINYIAVTGDPDAIVTYEAVNPIQIRVVVDVVNPVASASGDAGAAFGLMIDYRNDESANFGQSVFVTDLHHFDIKPPEVTPGRVAGINVDGLDGTSGRVRAYLSLAFVNYAGITDADQLEGYIDGIEIPETNFVNEGVDDTLGFEFFDFYNPSNSVLKAVISNDDWSPHDLQFGLIPKIDPNAKKKRTLRRKIKQAKRKLKRAKTSTKKRRWKISIKKLKRRLRRL